MLGLMGNVVQCSLGQTMTQSLAIWNGIKARDNVKNIETVWGFFFASNFLLTVNFY